MSKLYERLLVVKYGHLLGSSNLQFGFKKNVWDVRNVLSPSGDN